MGDKIFILDKKSISIFKSANSFLKQQGFKDTSLKDIALKAEVARKTLYNRFADRYDLFEKLINYTFSSLISLINLGNFQDFNELIENLTIKSQELPLTYSEQLRLELFNQYPKLSENLDKAEKSVIKRIAFMIKNDPQLNYKLRSNLNTSVAATLIWKVAICKQINLEDSLESEGLNKVYVENQIKDILYFGIFR